MQEIQVWSLCQEDPLEKWIATHFNILAWRISWTEEPGGLLSMGSQSWTQLSDYYIHTILIYIESNAGEHYNFALKVICVLQHSEGEHRPIFIQIFIISDVWYLIWNKNFLLSPFASALRTSFSIFLNIYCRAVGNKLF